MKHYLNFKPTIIYRKRSRFMLKTSLFLLYLIPAVLLVFAGVEYFNVKAISDECEAFQKRLAKRTSTFQEKTKMQMTSIKSLQTVEQKYLVYKKIQKAYGISWSELFTAFETITPKAVKFLRVRIRPDKVVKVFVEGKAQSISDMTVFLKALFDSEHFIAPNLKRQTMKTDGKSKEVTFSLEVGYFPKGGNLL